MRKPRGVLHRRELKLKKMTARVTSLRDGDEHVAMVASMLLSLEDELFLDTVTTTERENNGTAGSPLAVGARKVVQTAPFDPGTGA